MPTFSLQVTYHRRSRVLHRSRLLRRTDIYPAVVAGSEKEARERLLSQYLRQGKKVIKIERTETNS